MTEPRRSLARWSQPVALVASRELITRLHSKVFRILTLVMLALIVVMVLLFKFLAGSSGSAAKVGIPAADSAVTTSLQAAAHAVDQKLTVTTVTDAAAGRAAVAGGDLDALLLPGGGSPTVVVKSKISPELQNVFTLLARDLALTERVSALGGDPAAVSAAIASAGPQVDVLEPPRHYDSERLVLGAVTGVLIYITLLTGGQLVAQGVVEEKSSRVVELLLAAIRPSQLMAGKVFGIGLVGLLQVALWGIVGIGLAATLGVLTISATAAVGTVIWLVVWFLLGFILYAFAFAAAGALVSRQEEVAGVTMPVLTLVIVGYVLGIAILPTDPGNRLCEVLSVIPVFSPMLMPMRLAMGGVPAWQAALAVLLTLAAIPALAVLTGRIYRNAVMRTGSRVSLRQALRAA